LSSVLIIDDDAALTEMLKTVLEPKTYQVIAAHKIHEGLEAVRTLEPDIVLLDLNMDGTDGWHVCRAIREFSQTPILVLSVLNKPDAVAKALDEGADDYLIKPVTSGVLVAHLNNLIRRSRAEQIAVSARLGTS
jgi:two-component system, OmpR family, KDP operon response regulator KdpE